MPEQPQRPQLTPDQTFGLRVSRMAQQQCARLLGEAAGKQAAQRVTMAIMGAMQAARNPRSFHEVSDLSLANCIALSAQTGILPGGPSPNVYLVPQSARKGEVPELQWRITHRGISVLAYRAGFAIRAVPVGSADFLTVSLGEVVEHSTGADEWPATLDDLRGIAVVVRDIERGRDVIRAWVPNAVIRRRREVARDRGVWDAWPVEMAQKTAIKYCLARGAIPLDSPELAAALDADQDAIETTATETARPAARPAPAVATQLPPGLSTERPALQDRGEPVDELDGVRPRGDVRVTIEHEAAPEPARRTRRTKAAEPMPAAPPPQEPADEAGQDEEAPPEPGAPAKPTRADRLTALRQLGLVALDQEHARVVGQVPPREWREPEIRAAILYHEYGPDQGSK